MSVKNVVEFEFFDAVQFIYFIIVVVLINLILYMSYSPETFFPTLCSFGLSLIIIVFFVPNFSKTIVAEVKSI